MFKRIAWMLLAGLWFFVTAAFISFSPNDYGHIAAPLNVQPGNWCGWVGAAAAYQGYYMLGPGVWVILVSIGMFLGVTAIGKKVDQLGVRAVGVATMALAASGFVYLFFPSFGPMPEGSGGLIAIAGVRELYSRFNTLGTALMLSMIMGVGAMMAVDEFVLALPKGILAVCRKLAGINWPKPVLVGMFKGVSWPRFGGRHEAGELTGPPGRSVPLSAREKFRAAAKKAQEHAELDITDPDLPEPEEEIERFEREVDEAIATEPVADPEVEDATDPTAEADDADEAEAPAVAEDPVVEEKKPLDPEALREKIEKIKINFASQNKPKHAPVAPVQDLSGYRFPDIALLSEPETNFTQEMDKIVREQAMALERSLQTYKIQAGVVDIQSGPVITLYDVQPEPGVKVAQFTAIAMDLARELKAQNIRIVPNTAGKTTIGIEVPNLKKEKVRLKELMALAGPDLLEKMRLPMFLGKDASGEPLIADLAQMPHMLIAGTTGSGKSVCMNSIIMSFLYTRRPDELKLVLVDPKMVEMSQFKDIPHLMCPVVTEMNKAAAILEWAVTKMDERYELMAEAGVRDIDGFNALSWEEKKEIFKPASEAEETKIPRKLPRLVFVIDELADLMLTNKEVEHFIVRIAQKARAVGIHLILATQRPQANVVTGLIKSNMPCRVAFKVASGMDSRIVLDHKGAELLLGQGDMLYLSPRTSKLMRAQGTLVDDAEVRATVRFLKNVAAPSFEPQLVQLKAPGQALTENVERDEMFEDAVQVMLETGRGSVSLLQRRLGIGYGRASRLVDEMASAGILGAHKEGQARECLISIEEWEAMKTMMAQADAGVEVNGAIPEADTAAEERELAALADGDEPEDGKKQGGDYNYVDEDEPA